MCGSLGGWGAGRMWVAELVCCVRVCINVLLACQCRGSAPEGSRHDVCVSMKGHGNFGAELRIKSLITTLLCVYEKNRSFVPMDSQRPPERSHFHTVLGDVVCGQTELMVAVCPTAPVFC